MTSIRSELALFCAFRPPPVPCRRLHRPLVTVGVERCQTTAKNGARIVVDKRSLWQRKALKGSRLRLLIRGVLAAFLVVVVKEAVNGQSQVFVLVANISEVPKEVLPAREKQRLLRRVYLVGILFVFCAFRRFGHVCKVFGDPDEARRARADSGNRPGQRFYLLDVNPWV